MAPSRIDRLTPAISADEWTERINGRISSEQIGATVYAYPSLQTVGIIERDGEWEDVCVAGEDGLCAIMALANAALRDGHPLKLTREHVRWLRQKADLFQHGTDKVVAAALADALDALLPPA